MTAYNKDLKSQIDSLNSLLNQSRVIQEILHKVSELKLPHWYLGAGCVAQTIWNAFHGFDLSYAIKDYDLVYYDAGNISEEQQREYNEKAKELFPGLTIEITNEARVHVWYEKQFGKSIEPYQSVEEAINTWPTTATSIGVRHDEQSGFSVYAPYGLNDLFGMIVRANKKLISKEVYLSKVERWKKSWNNLIIVSWDQ